MYEGNKGVFVVINYIDNVLDNMHEKECSPQPNKITYPQPPLNSKMPKFNIMGKSDKKRKEIYRSQVVINCFK